jgi:two-component system, NtrC family, sensor kinase
MKCPRCQQDNPSDANFCKKCGTPLHGIDNGPYEERPQEVQHLTRALREALERQTATGEILRVISSSPADIQPVFDTIARNASRLCDGMWTVVVRYDGELIHLVANENPRVDPEARQLRFPAPATRRSLAARPILEETIVHITDVTADPDVDQEVMATLGVRAYLGVPMMQDGRPIGSINVSKAVATPFTYRQIELLQTFADQAVIAIENVRLFKELEARNRDLSESLDRQTATAEILRVVSRSQTDVQPVFDAIATSAARLFGAWTAGVYRFDGELLHLAGGAGEAALGRTRGEGFDTEGLQRMREGLQQMRDLLGSGNK